MIEELLTRAFIVLIRSITAAAEQARQPSKQLPRDFPRADAAEQAAKDRLAKPPVK